MSGYNQSGSRYEHREIAAKALGRPLKRIEIVHHVDNDGKNNSPNNLVICPNQKYHMILHARQRVVDLGGHPDLQKYCSYHKTIHDREAFSSSPSAYDGLHTTCREGSNTYRRDRGIGRGKSNFTWEKRLAQQYRRVFSNYTRREICPLFSPE